MNRIIFATGNAGKMKEIREILGDMDAEILSMKEAGIQTDIVETGRHLRKCQNKSKGSGPVYKRYCPCR